jgi:hypothetical protein
MSTPAVGLPDLQTLAHRLNAALNQPNSTGDPITILARKPNPRTSTYPSEIVYCRLADGSELQLLCKYATARSHTAQGHRRGTAYEAEVYQKVLQPLPVSTPRFCGLYADSITGETWFMLEYMDGSMRVKDSRDRTQMYAAARWLGQFHRINESRLPPASLPFLHKHEPEYYLGWAARTSQFAGHLHQSFPWLRTLCERFEQVVGRLLEPPAIIIHGEYYPNNILFRQGTIYPVDWESTAIGIGEIDYASLTERWPAEIVERCRIEYLNARWPAGPPADFEPKLDVARLYWRFRWLGERADWTTEEKSRWRFADLHSLGTRLGLI